MFLELFLFAKKMKFWDLLYFPVFQVFPWHFYFMRGHSFVELAEHDDSAADIILHSIDLVPSPSETWFRGMSVGGSFRRV